MMHSLFLAAVLFGSPQDVVTPKVGSPVRTQVLDAFRAKTKGILKGKKVVFKVDHMKQLDDWVFFKGVGQNPDGSKLDYHGTEFQKAINDDMFEDWCCALFHRSKGKWKVIDWSWGGTDVSYDGWWDRHNAPRSIFPSYN